MTIRFPGEYLDNEENDRTSKGLAQIAGVEKYGSVDGSVTRIENLDAGNITTGTLSADRIGAGSITTDKLSSDYIVVGDAASDVNSHSVEIDPGRILISGNTQLADWRHGSDQTLIDGGDIYANSVTANQISADAIDGMTITGALVRTSSSGSRVELSNSGLRVYNSSNTNIGAYDWGGAWLASNQVFNFAGTGNSLGQIYYDTSLPGFNITSSYMVYIDSGTNPTWINSDLNIGGDVTGLSMSGNIDMNGRSIKSADQIVLQKKSKGYSSDYGSIYYYSDGGEYFGSNNDGWDGRFLQEAQ